MIICRSEKRLKIVKLAVILVGLIAIGVLGNKALPKIKGVIPTQTAVTQNADITQNVNFRKDPSLGENIIRQLKKGDTVTLTGEVVEGWTQITHNGDTGWVSSEFLKVWEGEQTAAPKKAEPKTTAVQTAALTAFPSEFAGIWKRDNYSNTLTFTEKP